MIALLGTSGFLRADLVTVTLGQNKGDWWHVFSINPFKVQVDTTADKCKCYDVTWGAWAIGFNEVLDWLVIAYGLDDPGGNGVSRVIDEGEGGFTYNHLMDIDPDTDNAYAIGWCFFHNWFWGSYWSHEINLICDASNY